MKYQWNKFILLFLFFMTSAFSTIYAQTPTITPTETQSLTETFTLVAAGPDPVDLLSASNFVILAQTGITDTGSHASAITGNIGTSPGTSAQMDGIWCSQITGTIYGVDMAYTGNGNTTCFAGNPPLANKTLVDNAIADMLTAYNYASGVVSPPPVTGLGAGNIGGMTLYPGLYKWGTDVIIPSDITLSGGAGDVWIFQISGDLDIASAGSVPTGIKVLLSGGAQASNIFWQVGGLIGTTLGSYSTFNGIILSAKQIIFGTGAVLNGRALSQTQVILDSNPVTEPLLAINNTYTPTSTGTLPTLTLTPLNSETSSPTETTTWFITTPSKTPSSTIITPSETTTWIITTPSETHSWIVSTASDSGFFILIMAIFILSISTMLKLFIDYNKNL